MNDLTGINKSISTKERKPNVYNLYQDDHLHLECEGEKCCHTEYADKENTDVIHTQCHQDWSSQETTQDTTGWYVVGTVLGVVIAVAVFYYALKMQTPHPLRPEYVHHVLIPHSGTYPLRG